MDLRNLNIIYSKVPNFMSLTEGMIIGLYMIFENKNVKFFVEIKYADKENEKIGLFGFDLEKYMIVGLKKEEYIKTLEKIERIKKDRYYFQIKEELKRIKDVKNIVELDKYFIYIDEESIQPEYNSKSFIKFNEINYEIESNVSVLYCSPSLATLYCRIEKNRISKEKIKKINYSTSVELNIEYNNDLYNDSGNIREINSKNNELEIVIEPIQVTFLESHMMNVMHFNKVTAADIIKVLANITNTFEVGKVDGEKRNLRKYKYITTLNNFRLQDEILQIGDIIFSKNIEDFSNEKIQSNSEEYIYVSTYIVAETISEAQKNAIRKIENILNIIQLIEKNSCFYKLYNEKDDFNDWNIENIFIDYKIGDKFYIFNIFEPEEYVYGSNRDVIIKKYGYLGENSDVVVYNNEINQLILNNINSKDNLLNAIYWLNKAIEEINFDLNKCVLYLNIALEYCANGEKGKSFFEENKKAKEIYQNIDKFLDINYHNDTVANELINKLKWTLSTASLRNRFENMIDKLDLGYTDEQIKSYNKIREARNDIIHGRKKVKVKPNDIIECYMFLSKIMFYKLKEI